MTTDEKDDDKTETEDRTKNEASEKLRVKAFGPAADAFGREIAPLGTRGGKLVNGFGQVLYDVVEGLSARCKQGFVWLKDRVEELSEDVPKEKLVKPDPRIIGPIILDIGLSMEEATIREMYAKLAAADINADTKSLAHPSFVDIIKQMSAKDTRILATMREAEAISIASLPHSSGGQREFDREVSFEVEGLNKEDVLFCLSNLARLGIIELNTATYPILAKDIDSKLREKHKALETSDNDGNVRRIRFTHTGIYLSPIGKRFKAICL